MRRAVLLPLIAIVPLVFSGCAAVEDAASAVGTGAACTAANAVADDLGNLVAGIDGSEAVADLQQRADGIADLAAVAATAVGAIDPAAGQALQQAGEDFADRLAAIPADAGAAAADAAAGEAAQGFSSAVQDTLQALGC
jgi:hypothetical protein